MTTLAPGKKIIDILSVEKKDGTPYVSLEYFPPRTDDGVKNLYSRMDRMKALLDPAFTDITWGAGGSTSDLSMQIALQLHKTGHQSNMHLTCTNIQNFTGDPKQAVSEALQTAWDGGIRNIVALRGDPPAGENEWKVSEGGFTCGLDLVVFIREKYGDGFGISVAGYPEGHPNAISEMEDPSSMTATEKARSSNFDGKTYCCKDADYKKEMDYLKQKVDAGADFIITQMFFDSAVYISFCENCIKWGINCPVVPGLMCINAYPGFAKMTKFCKARVPAKLQADMDAIKDDDAAVKAFGTEYIAQMCKDMIASGHVKVLHFYTLNLEKVVYGVLDKLGLSTNALSQANELDAASQVAKGSAWARVGDKVLSIYGSGTVMELNAKDGAAAIKIESWTMAGGQNPTAYLQKPAYKKIM